jgi:acyl-lipid omega-6 desaturase (Delta-12 desaturase)
MRSEREVLMATKQYASEDRLTSWFVLWSTLGLYFLATVVAFASFPFVLRLASSIVSGLLIVRLFIIYHDYQHRAILTKSWLAEGIMQVFGMWVLSPTSVWNRSHDHHHKHNSKEMESSIGSFPTMTAERYTSASWFTRFQYVAARHPLMIGLGYLTVFMGGMCIRPLMIGPRQHLDALMALILHIAATIAFLSFGWDVLLLCMTLPLAIACGLGSYLFYAQHNFPGCLHNQREDWTHASAALRSSSYIAMSPIMMWFTGNIGYHHIHHLNAKIPFYRLPEAMAGMPELQKPASTTLRPTDVFACFQQNLWDADREQFVTYRQAWAA